MRYCNVPQGDVVSGIVIYSFLLATLILDREFDLVVDELFVIHGLKILQST